MNEIKCSDGNVNRQLITTREIYHHDRGPLKYPQESMESPRTESSAVYLLVNRAENLDEVYPQKRAYRYRKLDTSSQQCAGVGSSLQSDGVDSSHQYVRAGTRDVIGYPTDLHLYLQSHIHRRHHGRRSQTHGFHGRHSAKLTGRSLPTSRSTSQSLVTHDIHDDMVQDDNHGAVEDVTGTEMVTKAPHSFKHVEKETQEKLSPETVELQKYNQNVIPMINKCFKSQPTSKLETKVALRLPPLLSNTLISPSTSHELPSRTLKLLHGHHNMLLGEISRTPRADMEHKPKRRFPPAALRSVILPGGEVSQWDLHGEQCKQVMSQQDAGHQHNAVSDDKLHDLPLLKQTDKMLTKGRNKRIRRQKDSVFMKRGLQNNDKTGTSCDFLSLEDQHFSNLDPRDRIYPYGMTPYPGLHDRGCGVRKPVATERMNATLMYELRVAGWQHHPQNNEMTSSSAHTADAEESVQQKPLP